jgi:hypothetical protein
MRYMVNSGHSECCSLFIVSHSAHAAQYHCAVSQVVIRPQCLLTFPAKLCTCTLCFNAVEDRH